FFQVDVPTAAQVSNQNGAILYRWFADNRVTFVAVGPAHPGAALGAFDFGTIPFNSQNVEGDFQQRWIDLALRGDLVNVEVRVQNAANPQSCQLDPTVVCNPTGLAFRIDLLGADIILPLTN